MINLSEDNDYIHISYQLPEHNSNACWWDVCRNVSAWSQPSPEYSLFAFLQALTGISEGYDEMALSYYFIQTVTSERLPAMRISPDSMGFEGNVYSLESLISEIYNNQHILGSFVSRAKIKLLKPMKYRIKKKKKKAKACNRYGRKPIGNALKVAVMERDNYTCQMCGRTVKDGAVLHIDHINPVANGGGNNIENLQVLCSDCNHGKHAKTYLKHDAKKKKELKEFYRRK